jgi:hypothetical protein
MQQDKCSESEKRNTEFLVQPDGRLKLKSAWLRLVFLYKTKEC